MFGPEGALQNSDATLLTLLKGKQGASEERRSPATLSPRDLGTRVAQRDKG